MEKLNPQDKKETEDSLLDLLIIAYAFGVEDVNKSTNSSIKVSRDKMYQSIYSKIDGKTWQDRLKEYDSMSQYKILADNELSRVFSDGQWDCANEIGGLYKTWNDMGDDRVRDSHWYLGGMTIPLEEYFTTLNGNMTLYPRRFGIPEEDVNCRCWLTYSRRGVIDEQD